MMVDKPAPDTRLLAQVDVPQTLPSIRSLSTLLHLAYDPVLAAPTSLGIAALLRKLE